MCLHGIATCLHEIANIRGRAQKTKISKFVFIYIFTCLHGLANIRGSVQKRKIIKNCILLRVCMNRQYKGQSA